MKFSYPADGRQNQGKEDTNMLYEKPELVLQGAAIRVIEHHNAKPSSTADNECTEDNATSTAYQADE
jgi:hypothetical protein